LVLIAMALTPSHRAEFWTSVVSVTVALLAFVFVRQHGARTGRSDAAHHRVPDPSASQP